MPYHRKTIKIILSKAMKHTKLLMFLLCLSPTTLFSTEMHFYRNDGKYNVYEHKKLNEVDFNNDTTFLNFANGATFEIADKNIDSIVFKDECKVAEMYISTEEEKDITSKDTFINCMVTVKGYDMFDDLVEYPALIRGRGNSTWEWYPKKPYRLKFEKKQNLIGLKKGKVWSLLANYRDPTYLMNALVFEMGDYLGLQFNNHSRFCELFVNNEYKGLYLLTEQIKQGNNRVEVNDDNGILIALDSDDGPELSPDATDNFWNMSFYPKYRHKLPVSIKYPKDELLTDERKTEVSNEFNALADLIANHNYDSLKKVMDMKSYIDYLIIQDLTYNVELRTPRSMFLYKNTLKDSLWHMGPLWDFDGGFYFSWADMENSRTYFEDNGSLLVTKQNDYQYGPWGGRGGQQNTTSTINYDVAVNNDGVCPFFTSLFYDQNFIDDFKARWNEIKPNLLPMVFAKVENYYQQTYCAMQRDQEQWNLSTSYEEEFAKLEKWLTTQVELLDGYYNGIIVGEE